jgi:outer membrane beta-barrel protein
MNRSSNLRRALLLGAVLPLAILALPGVSSAAGIAGPKRSALEKLEEGDAIRHRRFLRGGRFEVTPATAYTLNDPYQRNLLFGVQLTYHFNDAWALGWTGFLGIGLDTGLAEEIKDERPEKAGGFSNVGLIGSADVYYSPIQGKYAIFGRTVVHYDIHFLAGFGGTKVSGDVTLDDVAFAPVLGLGFRNFINDWIAVNLEVRDYIFSSALNAVTETNETGEEEDQKDFEINQNFAVLLGVSFYFPTKPEVGP